MSALERPVSRRRVLGAGLAGAAGLLLGRHLPPPAGSALQPEPQPVAEPVAMPARQVETLAVRTSAYGVLYVPVWR